MIASLFALVLSTVPQPASNMSPETSGARWLAGPFTFYVENDSLPLAGGDESYTQGLELHLTLSQDAVPFPLNVLRRATAGPLDRLQGERAFENGSSFFFGQTIFTPQNIITYAPRQDDRPFVGFLYGGVSSVIAADWAEDEGKTLRPRRITGQISAGVTGYDLALAHTAQAAFHVLRESRIPKGWSTQAGNRPEANALLIWEEMFSPRNKRGDPLDLTIVGKAALGTTQIYGSAEGVIRAGWNLSGFPPANIPRAADIGAPRRIEVASFVGAEVRASALNRLADQGGEGRPSFKPLVYEWRIGAMARLKNGLTISYAVRRRSQEIEPLPPGLLASHWIGSLQIAKSPGDPAARERFAFMKGVRANLRLGRGGSSTEPGLPADPRLSLAGHWGLEKSLFSNRWAVAVEATGVAREHGLGDGTSHQDTFLLAKVATLGREVLPRASGRHRLQLRLGGGMSLVKTQTTPSEGDIDEPELPEAVAEKGWSGLAGVRYAKQLGKYASIATDLAVSRLYLDGSEAGVRRAAYWTWTWGLQLHPWGRDRQVD